MKQSSLRRESKGMGTRAFTLVEVLVAEAIFLILLLVVMQLIFGVVSTAGAQKKRMDALGDARQSLDRLSLDWSSRVRRSDSTGAFTQTNGAYLAQGSVTGVFTKQPGNDQLAFLSQVQTYTGARRVGWVSYQVNPITQVIAGSQPTSTWALERGLAPYDWSTKDAGGNPQLIFPVSTAPTLVNNEPLGNTIFRLEICFFQKIPAGSTTSPFTVDNSANLTSTNFAGVVVAVAALDQQSRQILSQTQLTALAGALPRVTADGQDPQSVWVAAINGTNGIAGPFIPAATAAGIPKSISSAVRIYQRILYLRE